MISYLSHSFSKHFENSMMLYLSKCSVFKDFETNMNIIYWIAKNIAIEKKLQVVIVENLMNEDIFKLSDSKMIIISIKIVWQQNVKATINKFNKLSNEAIEEDEMKFEKCFLQQQCV